MVRDLEQYSQWRQGVMGAVANYRDWIVQADLSDAATEQRLAQTLSSWPTTSCRWPSWRNFRVANLN